MQQRYLAKAHQHSRFFAFAGIAVKKFEAHCNAVVAYLGRVGAAEHINTQPVLLIYMLVVFGIYADFFFHLR
jgi:hypothetical protein